MTTPSQKTQHLTAMLDEYKELSAEIRARVDLQHRNMNVLIVLVTAVSGYLVAYASDHGLSAAPGSLTQSVIVLLVVALPIITNVFLWRHFDHDVNIIDKATYIHHELGPSIREIVGRSPAIGFEAFLHERRKERPRGVKRFVALGQEDIPMFLVLAMFLAAGWYLRITTPERAAEAWILFDILLYLGTVLTPIAVALAIEVGHEYERVGAEIPDEKITSSKSDDAAGPVDHCGSVDDESQAAARTSRSRARAK